MSTDTRLIKSTAAFGTITANDATATTGVFAGYFVTSPITLSEVLDVDGTDITAQILKGGAGTQQGGYHTPRTTGQYISSVTHDGTGEIVLVYANADY